jgi:hypothetical protein
MSSIKVRLVRFAEALSCLAVVASDLFVCCITRACFSPAESSTRLLFHYDKAHELCATVQPPPKAGAGHLHPPGHHVLTVQSTSHTHAIIAWIVTA